MPSGGSSSHGILLIAVESLKAEGIDQDDLLTEITKLFYVDLDAFNDVLNAAR